MSQPKYRRDKLVVVYDESARKEYLTGFHKRKLARRKAAEAERIEMEKAARREAVRKVRDPAMRCTTIAVPRRLRRAVPSLRMRTTLHVNASSSTAEA